MLGIIAPTFRVEAAMAERGKEVLGIADYTATLHARRMAARRPSGRIKPPLVEAVWSPEELPDWGGFSPVAGKSLSTYRYVGNFL